MALAGNFCPRRNYAAWMEELKVCDAFSDAWCQRDWKVEFFVNTSFSVLFIVLLKW